ncbi:MAG: prepilin-type N-terminal cleavage/methylation domain-containing protein [Planctomycetes bacterium]|nr:prepilin-type N-terminal cleavage/methylation domain-containing protein [Planctomycetota bacterium]
MTAMTAPRSLPRRRGPGAKAGGFSLVEILVVLTIIVLLLSTTYLAISNIGGGEGLEGVGLTLRGNFELARSTAVQKHTKASIVFKYESSNRQTYYTVTYETSSGGANPPKVIPDVYIPLPMQRVDALGVTQTSEFRVDFMPDGTADMPGASDVAITTFDDGTVDNELGEVYFTDTPGSTPVGDLLVINVVRSTGRFQSKVINR